MSWGPPALHTDQSAHPTSVQLCCGGHLPTDRSKQLPHRVDHVVVIRYRQLVQADHTV